MAVCLPRRTHGCHMGRWPTSARPQRPKLLLHIAFGPTVSSTSTHHARQRVLSSTASTSGFTRSLFGQPRHGLTPRASANSETELLPERDLQDEDSAGPVFQATLKLLQWQLLCSYVADFASTAVGRRQCSNLAVPTSQAVSERMIAETR